MSDITTRGRGWAYAGTIIGGGLSIAANVMHSFIPPVNAAADWAPEPGAVVFSTFWPICLFIAVEVLARVVWPKGALYVAIRFGGLIPIAYVAFSVSYGHMSSLFKHWGEDEHTQMFGPIAIDGLMVIGSAALMVIGKNTATKASALTSVLNRIKPNTDPAPVADGGHSVRPPATTHSDDTPAAEPVAIVDPVLIAEPVNVPAHLLNTARFTMTNFENTIGRTITADELAATINVTPSMARLILAELGETVPAITSAHLNGTPVGAR
ncbi:hypothetical protein [Catellatospora citrea]|uniref:Uncharacterized protein n=1 Tax=Catellatospora citrea TaxID=53366 RepID=A0A8J3P4D0_9ACTN|nr:hypothetical protein [Catellatospora citrea]RKE08170.1 hypothetical protein C8E86_3014 [Catellatospora citrea]GIG03244.1 hypothetical protein Cci01nite_83370 [Catellatospora citrea]